MRLKFFYVLRKIPRIKREWWQILAAFFIMRLLISGVAAFTLWNWQPLTPQFMNPQNPTFAPTMLATADNRIAALLLVNGWARWDTNWYIKISQVGYDAQDESTSFLPLYPLLIRFVQSITHENALLSALLVANIFCIFTLLLFYEVALHELGPGKSAWQAFLYLITFPSSFFLFAGYSESLFLTLVLAMWLLIRKGHWLWAAFVSSLAALTRSPGIILIFPFFWQALASAFEISSQAPFQEVRLMLHSLTTKEGWRKIIPFGKNPAWIGALFPGFAFLFYNVGLNVSGFGSVLGSYSSRGSQLHWPWMSFWEFIIKLFGRVFPPLDYVDVILFIAFMAATIYGLRKISPALSVYNLAFLGMFFSRSIENVLLPSFMRYVLPIFPFFLVLSKLISRDWAKYLVISIFLAMQLILVFFFVNWLGVA